MRGIIVMTVLWMLLSCSRGVTIMPWEGYGHAFDKDGRSAVIIDRSKHHYMLFTDKDGLRMILYHTPEGKIDKIKETSLK